MKKLDIFILIIFLFFLIKMEKKAFKVIILSSYFLHKWDWQLFIVFFFRLFGQKPFTLKQSTKYFNNWIINFMKYLDNIVREFFQQICFKLLSKRSKKCQMQFSFGHKTAAPGEARTHGLQIMRLTRCLLRYRGWQGILDKYL